MTALPADSTVARDEIHVAENVQALDVEHLAHRPAASACWNARAGRPTGPG